MSEQPGLPGLSGGPGSQQSPSDAEFVVVAEVVKAVGRKGELKLYPLLDWYPPLLESQYLQWESGDAIQVIGHRQTGDCSIVLLAGCHDRDAAEARLGQWIGFQRGNYLNPDFPRPPGGLPFRYLDREVRLVSGEVIGCVHEVRRYPSQVILVVQQGEREILVPAVEPILQPTEGLVGPLIIDPPEGLLDVAGD